MLRRGRDEGAVRRDVQKVLGLLPRYLNVVEQDERVDVLKVMANLRLGRLERGVVFVEGVEERLEQVVCGLAVDLKVDDARREGVRTRVVGEVTQKARLAGALLAAALHALLRLKRADDRFGLRHAVEQARKRARAKHDGLIDGARRGRFALRDVDDAPFNVADL